MAIRIGGDRLGHLIALFSAAGYGTFFAYYMVLKYRVFWTGFDLAIYNQAFWNVLNRGGLDFFGSPHYSPILYLLLPFYAVRPGAETLLVLQSFVISLTILPVYLIARREFSGWRLPVAFGAVFMLYAPLHGLASFDFHPEAFLPVLLLSTLYCFEAKLWRLYLIFLVLTLSSIEYASYLIVMMGVYMLWRYYKRARTSNANLDGMRRNLDVKMGVVAVTTGVGLGLSYYGTRLAPLASLMLAKSSGIAANELLRYPMLLLGPLAFTPFLHPSAVVMAFPWIVFALGSGVPEYVATNNQYTAFAAPFLLYASIRGLARKGATSNATKFIALLLTASAFFTVSSSFVATSPWPVEKEHHTILRRFIDMVPNDVRVLTQNDIISHLTGPRTVSISGNPLDFDYVLVDSTSPLYTDPVSNPPLNVAVALLESSGDYRAVASSDGITLYAKSYL